MCALESFTGLNNPLWSTSWDEATLRNNVWDMEGNVATDMNGYFTLGFGPLVDPNDPLVHKQEPTNAQLYHNTAQRTQASAGSTVHRHANLSGAIDGTHTMRGDVLGYNVTSGTRVTCGSCGLDTVDGSAVIDYTAANPWDGSPTTFDDFDDYEPAAGSVLVDAGVATPTNARLDALNRVRPADCANADQGAFERGASVYSFDFDGDGLLNHEDSCPTIPQDPSGLIDLDGDAVDDACDTCLGAFNAPVADPLSVDQFFPKGG